MAIIKCPECGCEISDKSKKCIHCGYKLNGKNRKKKVGIAVLAAAVILGSGGAGFWLVSGYNVRHYMKEIKNNQFENAQSIYEKKIKGKTKEQEVKKKTLDELQEKVENYAKDEKQFDNYTAMLNFVQQNFNDEDLSNVTKEVDEIKLSKDNYKSGNDKYSEKEYQSAINFFNKVIKTDGNYENAQNKIEECKQQIKTSILEKIENSFNDSTTAKLEAVKKEIQEDDSLKNDSDIKAKLEETNQKFTSDAMEKAKNLVKKKEYVSAYETLEDRVPKDNESDEVKKEKQEIKKKIVSWASERVNIQVKKKDYDQALDILNRYLSYDDEKKLSKLKKKVEDSSKASNISKFQNLLNSVTIKYDSVEDNYKVVYKGYKPDYVNVDGSINVEGRATISKKEKTARFSMLVGFRQDDWIFTDTIQISAGDYRATYDVERSELYTQVLDGGDIAEWIYLDTIIRLSDEKLDKVISKITTPQKTIIRFSGDGHGQRNHTITESEKDNIKVMLQITNMLKKYDYLYEYIK